MRIILFLLVAALSLSGCSGNRTWTRGDYIREGVGLAVKTIDWRQTREIAKNPDRYWEINPIIGKHPSTSRVDAYFALTTIGHVLVTHAIPHPYRPYWQYISIGASTACVVNNYNIGLKIEW
jgi:hypothetical protein